MKSTVIRTVLVFAAGAGCATLAGGMFAPEPITVEQFQERATGLLAQIDLLGRYVDLAEDGRVRIMIDPIACIPNPPSPKLPQGAVDSRYLRHGMAALMALEEGLILGVPEPVYTTGKCKPYAN